MSATGKPGKGTLTQAGVFTASEIDRRCDELIARERAEGRAPVPTLTVRRVDPAKLRDR